jgi:uncharacterized protein (TIGR02284 family)
MATDSNRVIAILNNLVTTCKDGENGYRSAGEDVDTPQLKELFRSATEQRAQFASELLAEIHRLDVAAQRPGTTLGRIHRGWMNMKAALTRRDVSSVINECERGEHAAASDYEDALKQELPEEVRALVERQHARVKEAHDRIAALKIIATLNRLIAACRDGEKGYHTAARDVHASDLKELFDSYAQQRAQLAAELEDEVRRLGDAAQHKGTWAGLLHRGWMNLKATFKGRDAAMILAECERGEQAALEVCEEARGEPMADPLRALLERLYTQVKETQGRLQALREQASSTPHPQKAETP